MAHKGKCIMSDGKFAGWRKSSYSGDGNSCVEVANGSTTPLIGVRDSKRNGRGPVLKFSPAAWQAFIGQIKTASL
jgi:Domain of unknown function (DUF397)